MSRRAEITQVPGEAQRLSILKTLLKNRPLAPDVSLGAIATQTAALVLDDIVDLVIQAQKNAVERIAFAR